MHPLSAGQKGAPREVLLARLACAAEGLAQLDVTAVVKFHRLAETWGLCEKRVLRRIRLTTDVAEVFLCSYSGL